MYLSENPRRDGCNDSETEMSHDDDGLKVKIRDDRAFDIKAFHQLRLELLESQRIVNQERVKRQVLRSPPCVRLVAGSTFWSPSSSVVDFPSSTDIPQAKNILTGASRRESFGASGAYDGNYISSARQELLRLGRRYASVQEPRPLTTHTNCTSSLDLTRVFDGYARQALFSDTTFLDSSMRASGHLDAQTSTEGIGTPGFYLLLARTHLPPNHENSIIDDEDGSASESYSTPTAPHLYSFDQQLEDKSLKRPKGMSMRLRRADHEDFMQQQTRRMDRRIKKSIKVSSLVLAGLAVLFSWRYTLNWRTHTHLDSTSIYVQYSACFQSMQQNYWSMKTRFEKRVDQLLCLREHNTTSWAKLRRINPVSVFTECRQHFDWISCIIKSVYRFQKGYQDALAIAVAAKYKCLGVHRYAVTITKAAKHSILEVQQMPLVAWNTSLAFFTTFWRSLTYEELADTSHRLEPHQFGRSLLTSPVLHWLDDDDDVSMFCKNDTMWLLDCAEVAEPAIGSMSWRKSIKLPFLRKQSPLSGQSYLHSIPSFDAVQADSPYPISSFTLPSKMNNHGNIHQLILLSRPRLILECPRLDGIVVSLEQIQNNVAASRVMHKTIHPKHIDNFKAVTNTVKRDYYESSYPFAEHSEGKNIFEDVNVMNMVHEFIGYFGTVLMRQSARRTVEYGIPMKHSL